MTVQLKIIVMNIISLAAIKFLKLKSKQHVIVADSFIDGYMTGN
jgi:hypothetical protein